MKCYKKKFLTIVAFLGFFVCSLGITCTAFSQDDFGVILVAHKSTRQNWNKEVTDLHGRVATHFNQTSDPILIKLAFLDFRDSEVNTLRNALETLMVDEGMNNILLVPLLTFSEIYNQKIIDMANAEAASVVVQNPSLSPPTIVIASAMDGNSYAITMLTRCAGGLSHDPPQESLLLVSYGDYDDTVNNTVLANLRRMAGAITNQVRFQTFEVVTLRPHHFDYQNNPKKNVEAIVNLRETAENLKQNGLVIVVPYVIQGDFHEELKDYLHKIVKPKHICKQEIISQPETEEWVKWVIRGGVAQSQQPHP